MIFKTKIKYFSKTLALFLMFNFVLNNQKILHAEDLQEEQTVNQNLLENSTTLESSLEETQTTENTDVVQNIDKEIVTPEEIIEVLEPEILVPVPQEKEQVYIPKKVYLEPTRKFDKEINFNPSAEHKCFSEVFNIDMSNKDNMTVAMSFEKDKVSTYDIEVGSLPGGIDVKFSNDSYIKTLGKDETSTLFKIKNSSNSNKGNYNISFIFTKKGAVESSSVCQINIVNK